MKEGEEDGAKEADGGDVDGGGEKAASSSSSTTTPSTTTNSTTTATSSSSSLKLNINAEVKKLNFDMQMETSRLQALITQLEERHHKVMMMVMMIR